MEHVSSSLPSRVSVADVLRWSVPVQWHEAVAVVRQAALRVTSGGPAPVDPALTSRASRREALEAADSPHLRRPPSDDDLDVIAIVDTSWVVPEPSGIWLT